MKIKWVDFFQVTLKLLYWKETRNPHLRWKLLLQITSANIIFDETTRKKIADFIQNLNAPLDAAMELTARVQMTQHTVVYLNLQQQQQRWPQHKPSRTHSSVNSALANFNMCLIVYKCALHNTTPPPPPPLLLRGQGQTPLQAILSRLSIPLRRRRCLCACVQRRWTCDCNHFRWFEKVK